MLKTVDYLQLFSCEIDIESEKQGNVFWHFKSMETIINVANHGEHLILMETNIRVGGTRFDFRL